MQVRIIMPVKEKLEFVSEEQSSFNTFFIQGISFLAYMIHELAIEISCTISLFSGSIFY